MAEQAHITALESLLEELPVEERATLLAAIRKANIPDENDILFHLLHVQGLFAKINERTARTISANLVAARHQQANEIIAISAGVAFALGVMAGALLTAHLAQGLIVLGLVIAAGAIGFLLAKRHPSPQR